VQCAKACKVCDYMSAKGTVNREKMKQGGGGWTVRRHY
jgi:hypothetical protein